MIAGHTESATHIKSYFLAHKHQICMWLVVALAIALKVLFVKYPFHGLEHEDAYVFADVGRYLRYDYPWNPSPFQTKACLIGSLENCRVSGTFGGHYMILPFLLYAVNALFGYSVYNIFVFNFLISLLVLFVFIRTLTLLSVNETGKCLATLLFVTTPFLNVFNTSGLSETLSSLSVICTTYYFLKSFRDDFACKKTSFWITIAFMVLSFLLKRENLILISLPLLGLIFIFAGGNLRFQKVRRLSIMFAVPFLTAFLYNVIAGVSAMEAAENTDIGLPTFALSHLFQLLPKYLMAFLEPRYFGITGALFLGASVYVLFFQKRVEYRVVTVLSLMYLLMYASHYRSYYQVHGEAVNTFAALRYASNYFPMACLSFGSLGFGRCVSKWGFHLKALALVLFLFFAGYLNMGLRIALNHEEQYSRILPTLKALESTKEEDWILTDMPCVFHLYASPTRNVISSYEATRSRVADLIEAKKGDVYILKNKDDLMDRKRYPDYSDVLSSFRFIKVKDMSSDYEMFKLEAR